MPLAMSFRESETVLTRISTRSPAASPPDARSLLHSKGRARGRGAALRSAGGAAKGTTGAISVKPTATANAAARASRVAWTRQQAVVAILVALLLVTLLFSIRIPRFLRFSLPLPSLSLGVLSRKSYAMPLSWRALVPAWAAATPAAASAPAALAEEPEAAVEGEPEHDLGRDSALDAAHYAGLSSPA